jgi:SAM-dependent methyltransferase
VSEANRRRYGWPGAAEDYHKNLFLGEHDLEALDADLKRALNLLGHPQRRRVSALDACGGTGNAALRLLGLGCDTHLVDIAEEMVAFYRRQCHARGYADSAQCAEILSFFRDTTRKFDLIVFSSALHHLEDPLLVLRHAQTALTPGGLIVTVFDPIKPTRAERLLLEPVRLLDRAITEPRQIVGGLGRVARRLLRGGTRYQRLHAGEAEVSQDDVGIIAEIHCDGMDDVALAREIERTAKLRVVHHDRHRQPWGVLTPYARMLLRKPTNFRFLLQNVEGA